MANGNGTKWMIWLVGSLFFVLTGVITVTGKGVIENDRRNTQDHIAIRNESIQENIKVRAEMVQQEKDITNKLEIIIEKLAKIEGKLGH